MADDSEEETKPWWQRMFSMPRFDLGSIFGIAIWGAVFAGIAFFVLKNFPGVGQWIQEKFPQLAAGLEGLASGAGIEGLMPGATENYLKGLSAEDARETLVDRDVPPDVAAVLTASDETWQGFLQLVKDANPTADGQPGTVSEATLLNDKTIFALMTRQRSMAQAIIRALPRATPGTPNATTARITAAMGTMIAVPGQLETLLNAENFALTMEAVAKFSPVAVTPEALSSFVRAVGMNGNAPTASFRTFITTALADPTKFQEALTAFIMTPEVLNNPAALTALANGIGPIDATTNKALAEMVQLLKFNAPAVTTLLTTLGAEKAQAFMAVMNSGDSAAISSFALDPANVAAFTAFARTADTGNLPESIAGSVRSMRDASPQDLALARELTARDFDIARVERMFTVARGNERVFSIDQTINSLTHGANRTALRTEMGKLTREQQHTLLADMGITPANMFRMLDLGDAIGRTAENWNNGRHVGTARVMRALGHMLLNQDMGPFKRLSAAELSNFFGVEANRVAFNNLIQRFDTTGMSADDAALITTLKGHWLMESGRGISQVLGDPRGAEFVLKQLNGQNTAVWFDVMTTPVLRDNERHLRALVDAMPQPDVIAPRTPPVQYTGAGSVDRR